MDNKNSNINNYSFDIENLVENILRFFPCLNKLEAEILVKRGFSTISSVDRFLNGTLDDLDDTSQMKDSDKFLFYIADAILHNEKIVVMIDFDADGILAGTIAILALRHIGADVTYYSNNRFIDGYGLSISSVDKILELYPDVGTILTVDNGVKSIAAVDYALSKNIKVVITDHHEVDVDIPLANAVIDPKRKDCNYSFKDLCGAGVIYKLFLLFYWYYRLDVDYIYSLADLVAVATIGDLVPLVGENRILVKYGIEVISKNNRLPFKMLKKLCNIENIDTNTISYTIVPALNSIGRVVGLPNKAVDIFLSDDADFIFNEVSEILAINERRKELTAEQTAIAFEMVKDQPKKSVIIVYSPLFSEGIIGLIASKIKEKYNKPTIVFGGTGDVIKGSARSVEGFNIKCSLDKVSYLLEGYGGHLMAAGLSIKKDKLMNFDFALNSDEILSNCKYLSNNQQSSCTVLDICNVDIVKHLYNKLGPFGVDFPLPKFELRNILVKKIFFMGEKKQHIKIKSDMLDILVFNYITLDKKIKVGSTVNVIGDVTLNCYNNKVSVQLIAEDSSVVVNNSVTSINEKGFSFEYSSMYKFTYCLS